MSYSSSFSTGPVFLGGQPFSFLLHSREPFDPQSSKRSSNPNLSLHTHPTTHEQLQ